MNKLKIERTIIMPLSDRDLLARTIKCEAGGEGDTGMRAVATAIMNRVHVSGGEYGRVNQGSLRNVLYQEGQFDCLRETIRGQYNPQNIYNIPADLVHYEIADWVLGGGKLSQVGNSLWYFNPYGDCIYEFPRNGSGTFHTRVIQHCFYRPTDKYYTT